MRFARTIAVVGVGLLWLGYGPVVLLLAAVSLYFRPVRAWLRPTRRVVGAWLVAVLALAGLAIVLPDGWVPIPPGPGALVTPGYAGRPAHAEPAGPRQRPNPRLARASFPGPLGESPGVRTRSYGVDGCREISVDSHGRLVALCGDADGPVLRLVDPDSLRQLASKDLPAGADAPCTGAFFLGDRDRIVVATHDRRLLVIGTADGDGEPDLTTQTSVSIADDLADDDCVVGLQPDWQGRAWFVSRDGRVGVVDGDRVRVLDLAEEVAKPLTVARDATYVVTVEALYRVDRRSDGTPVVDWRVAVEDSGSAPVVLPSGPVAVLDDDDVRLLQASDGEEVCQVELFGGALVAAGSGVVVQNHHGYGGPLSTALGRTTAGGLARVDPAEGDCTVTWTSDLVAPSGAPRVSLPSGLVYAYTKRHSWLGVNAWYLTALDLRTGRSVYAVRTGLGVLHDNHHGSIALGPDGSAYVPVLGGLVRVHDRD